MRLIDWLTAMRSRFLTWIYYRGYLIAARIEAHRIRKDKEAIRIYWRCARYQGGATLISPYPMNVAEVTKWIAQHVNAEVGYIDEERGWVFYRPIGNR